MQTVREKARLYYNNAPIAEDVIQEFESLQTFENIFEKELLKAQLERTEEKLKHEELNVDYDFEVKVTAYESLNHLNDNNTFEDRLKSYKDTNLRLFQQHLNEKATEKNEKMRAEILKINPTVSWFRKASRSNSKAKEFAVNAALFPLNDAVIVQSSTDAFRCPKLSITFVVNDYISQLQ